MWSRRLHESKDISFIEFHSFFFHCKSNNNLELCKLIALIYISFFNTLFNISQTRDIYESIVNSYTTTRSYLGCSGSQWHTGTHTPSGQSGKKSKNRDVLLCEDITTMHWTTWMKTNETSFTRLAVLPRTDSGKN